MTRRGHVRVDATVGTIRTTTEARRPVNLDVVDDQPVNVQSPVVGVGFGVLQQLQQELGRLLGPTANGRVPVLGLGAATDTTVEATEWNALLLLADVLQELLGTAQRHTLDG